MLLQNELFHPLRQFAELSNGDVMISLGAPTSQDSQAFPAPSAPTTSHDVPFFDLFNQILTNSRTTRNSLSSVAESAQQTPAIVRELPQELFDEIPGYLGQFLSVLHANTSITDLIQGHGIPVSVHAALRNWVVFSARKEFSQNAEIIDEAEDTIFTNSSSNAPLSSTTSLVPPLARDLLASFASDTEFLALTPPCEAIECFIRKFASEIFKNLDSLTLPRSVCSQLVETARQEDLFKSLRDVLFKCLKKVILVLISPVNSENPTFQQDFRVLLNLFKIIISPLSLLLSFL
jgi:hypothetical protein